VEHERLQVLVVHLFGKLEALFVQGGRALDVTGFPGQLGERRQGVDGVGEVAAATKLDDGAVGAVGGRRRLAAH
jgi:hypothetical protein